MNKLIASEDLQLLDKYFSILDSIENAEHEQKLDAKVKWAMIMKVIDDLNLRPKRILDAGSGKSHLSLAIDKMLENSLEEIYCIDLVEPIQSLKSNAKCKFEVGDFFSAAEKLESESFDLIVDGCSVTHFDTNCEFARNDGCHKIGKIATRILKPGAHLICSSDVLSFNDQEIGGEFVSIRSMENSYKSGGLMLLGEINDSTDNCVLVDYVVHGKNLAIASLVFRK